MKGLRFLLGDALICLPLGLIVLGGWFFFREALPRFEEREAERVLAKYRETAVAVKDGEAKNVRNFSNDGRRSKGPLSKGTWGVDDYKGRKLVWYRLPHADKISGVVADEIREFDYRRFFVLIGGAVLLLTLVLTNVGLRYFRRFVREREDFLAATAHDLTTPLVGMRMMIGHADDEAKRLNERMLLIVSNIKDFLRLGGKRRQPELKPVDIVVLTKEAYRLFAADYEDSESGDVKFCEGGPVREDADSTVVMADETMALQILWNLFGNDLKYAAPYGKVTVRFVQEAGFVRVEFVDEGQGMTPRQMKKAFDRYYRAKTVLESGKGGFGIGLCTAREFARAMGGDLTVRANTPKGCVFTLSLPLRSGQETGRASPIAGAIAPLP